MTVALGTPQLERVVSGDDRIGTVIFVHGTLDSSLAFARLERYLDGWRTVRYDRRGWGNSRRYGLAKSGLDTHAEDLLNILGEHPKPVVVGHSYGGLVTLRAAAARPDNVRAVAVFEPPIPWMPWWPPEAPWERVAREAREIGPGEAARQIRDAVTGGRFGSGAAPTDDTDGTAALAEMLDPDMRTPSFDPMTLTVPVVTAAGAHSLDHHRMTADHLAHLVPLGQYIEIEEADHLAHVTHPREFAHVVNVAAALAAERD